MRIAIDTHFITSAPATGNHTYTRGLVDSLLRQEADHRYILCATGPDPFYARAAHDRRVQLCHIGSPNGLIRNFVTLPRAIRHERPDLVHLQYLLPLRLGCPSLLAIHDLYYAHLRRPSFSQRVLRLLTAWSARRATHIVTLSAYSRRDICARLRIDPERVSVIALAADERFRPPDTREAVGQVRRRLNLREEYILFAGRTDDPRKNLPTLVEAYGRIRARGVSRAQLVLVGRDGSGTRALRALIAARGLSDEVVLPGIVPNEDLPSLIAGARVFVYPSSFEGFGLPALEAMACGTPVIASAAASLPEVVGDAGLLVPPGQVEPLAEAMERVLTDAALRERMIEQGLERARRFSWDDTARQTLRLYERLGRASPSDTPARER